jgi:lipoic acid synthetase
VAHGPDGPPDPREPARVAEIAQAMGLSYVVITSVTRDDLADGGAAHFAETIKEIRGRMPGVPVEVLVPDFLGDASALEEVLKTRPDVVNHNIETVPRLYPVVRPEARYSRSLELLKRVTRYDSSVPTKSGLMLGLGELPQEVDTTLRELFDAGCSLLTLGQYLQPTKEHLPVERFVSPEEFATWRETALGIGFAEVASAPFVRSSYRAKELYQAVSLRGDRVCRG